MKKSFPASRWWPLLALAALFSCNDPTVIGSDLLSGDELDIDYLDTMTLLAYNITEDSVKTFESNALNTQIIAFPFGDFQDPVFGRTTSSVFFQLSLNSSDPNLDSITLDSMVLLVPFDKESTYGNVNEFFELDVYEIDETLTDSVDYYSNRSIAVKPSPVGHATFVPRVGFDESDSVTIFVPDIDDDTLETETLAPHLRIRLDEAFAQQFLSSTDSTVYTDPAKFETFFKGFELRPASQNAGLVGFKLRSTLTGLKLYYHQVDDGDTILAQYTFPVSSGSVTTARYTHDYAGSAVAPFLQNEPETNDSLLFVQGMSGVSFLVEIPYADQLSNTLINRAELEMPILELPFDDTMAFDPVRQIALAEVVNDTTLLEVADFTLSYNRAGESFGSIFGGTVTANHTYRLNLSAHFQDVIAGSASNKIKVTVYLKPEFANRVVVAGPDHPVHPLRLKLSFTRY